MATVFGIDLSLVLLLVGAALLIAEAFAPGAYFIVLGIALLVAGLVGLALPASLGVFSVVIMAGLVIAVGSVALYVYQQFDFYGGKGSGQTSDSNSLRGKTGRVTERVTETDGQVKLDAGGFNPVYQARAFDDEIPVGEQIIVVDPGGGNVLTVESMAALSSDEIDEQLERGRESRGEHTEETAVESEQTEDAAATEQATSSEARGQREEETDTA